MPRLPFFCPLDCGHLNEHIDDEYLLEHGMCANCWWTLSAVPDIELKTSDEKKAVLERILAAARKKDDIQL